MTNRLIWTDEPSSWRDLQDKVCTLFQEMGCQAETEKTIELARGSVNVDVFVKDAEHNPPSTYICECKQWSMSVPKTIVHAFRTVITDSGAHSGFLISKKGFQKGALEAAQQSNIHLTTWVQFQNLFYDRWLKNRFAQLQVAAEPIFDYMDVLDDRVSKALDSPDPKAKEMFYGYFRRYSVYGRVNTWTVKVQGDIVFPFECPDPRTAGGDFVTFTNPREFFDVMFEWLPKAQEAFEYFLRKYGA